ncbi:hypothetical protein CEXT_459271 [Caerostris extrusa]|uniref:Uncharacterized protein n=1 Tax=Caerostris extrusa TaxID=172846 RepID=A0AAV4QED5_CAEEX|nr:hypothetical protein CEXT_459271 [Caerostris extrusa]
MAHCGRENEDKSSPTRMHREVSSRKLSSRQYRTIYKQEYPDWFCVKLQNQSKLCSKIKEIPSRGFRINVRDGRDKPNPNSPFLSMPHFWGRTGKVAINCPKYAIPLIRKERNSLASEAFLRETRSVKKWLGRGAYKWVGLEKRHTENRKP